MMKTLQQLQISLAAIIFAASASHAQDSVFKCTEGTGVSFQSSPCEEGPSMVKISSARYDQDADEETDAAPAVKALPPRSARPAIFSRSDRLEPGMSDLQVLNNRRWGKPQRITRNRESMAWHEHWAYLTGANGGKQLHFVNGILIHVENIEPADEAPGMVSALMIQGR